MPELYLGERRKRGRLLFLLVLLLVVLFCSRFIAGTLIDYEWWREMRQIETWFSLLLYGWAPVAIAAVLLFAAFYGAFRAGMRHLPQNTILFGFLTTKLLNRIAI